MEAVAILSLVVGVFLAFDLAALRRGVDSRDVIADDHRRASIQS